MDTKIRPELNEHISVVDFLDFYWLKEELVSFCRLNRLSTAGSKINLSNRIISFLKKENVVHNKNNNKRQSKFDWRNSVLTKNTIITDNYTNTENVRQFMKQEIGERFHFNVEFINWMKNNIGKTMGDAIIEWRNIKEYKNDKNSTTTILPQCEYNQYIRDFLKDNKNKTFKDAIHFWKLKKIMRGERKYSKTDLLLVDSL